MTNDEVLGTVQTALISKDSEIARLTALIVPTNQPLPPTTPPIPSASNSIVLLNMTFSNGIYTSNNLSVDGKCYLQIRVSTPPQNYAKLTVSRKTNIRADGTKNLKFMRVWPDGIYPNDYVARSLNTGAEQFTIEQGSSTVGYFSMPYKADTWIKEVYEFNYSEKTVKISYDDYSWSANGVNYGSLNRTQYGVQVVYAPNSGDSGKLPGGSFVQFKDPILEVR